MIKKSYIQPTVTCMKIESLSMIAASITESIASSPEVVDDGATELDARGSDLWEFEW